MKTKKPFIIRDILKNALPGCLDTKGAIWMPVLLSAVIYIIIAVIATAFNSNTIGTAYSPHQFLTQFITTLIIAVLTAPLVAGMFMVAITRARAGHITLTSGLQYYRYCIRLACINILIMIFAMIIDLFFTLVFALIKRASGYNTIQAIAASHYGLAAFIIVPIIMCLCYLAFIAFTLFALPVAVDQNKSPWKAISSGASIVLPHYIKLMGIIIIAILILFITSLPYLLSLFSQAAWVHIMCIIISLLILVWSFPYTFLIYGQAYKQLVD